MGHIRLGILPRYAKWKDVISLLGDTEAPASQVGHKVLDSSTEALETQSAQSSVAYCVWLIAQLTLASRSEDFKGTLARLGIHASEETTASEFLAAASRLASRHLSGLIPSTALNNIAGLALREALTRTIGIQARTLFGAKLADVQLALRKYATSAQFSSLLHIYFTSFLSRTLRFVVDKEIANHLGPRRRFENVREMEEFEAALEAFAGQTSRIVDKFSGGWYSKRVWQQGAISEADASRFVHVALNKLRADLNLDR